MRPMPTRVFALLLPALLALTAGALLLSGTWADARSEREALPLPSPDRPVARIISPAWDDEDARDRAGEAETVIRLMDIKAGDTVADIGAGAGYYTMRLSPMVGAQGRVIAQDITASYLDQLKRRVRKAGLGNVSFVRGTAADPRLQPESVDAALLVHMYHEIAEPYALLWRLRTAMRPDGRIGIVDLDRTPERHGMPRALLICEVRAVGFAHVATHDLKMGYLAIFKPAPRKDPRSVKACRHSG